jgi:hypothetical protein
MKRTYDAVLQEMRDAERESDELCAKALVIAARVQALAKEARTLRPTARSESAPPPALGPAPAPCSIPALGRHQAYMPARCTWRKYKGAMCGRDAVCHPERKLDIRFAPFCSGHACVKCGQRRARNGYRQCSSCRAVDMEMRIK